MAPRTEEQFQSIREKSKSKIVYAALELFSSEGYLNTSMAGIAKKAGVSKGLLYNYFEGKEDILKSILAEATEDGERIMNIDEDVSPKEHLRNILQRFFASARESVGFYRMIFPLSFQIHHFPFVQEMIQQNRDRYVGDIIKLFTALGYENPELEAWHLGAITDGYMLHLIHMEEDYPFEKMEKLLLRKYDLE